MHDNRLHAAAAAAGMSIVDAAPPRAPRRGGRFADEDRPPKIPDPLPPTWAPGPNARLLADLEPGDCRFPVGDATGADQLFCGDDANHGTGGYCPTCARRILPKGAPVNPKVLR